MISSRNFAAVGAATRTKKSELLVGGARRRVDRCELFFHVAATSSMSWSWKVEMTIHPHSNMPRSR